MPTIKNKNPGTEKAFFSFFVDLGIKRISKNTIDNKKVSKEGQFIILFMFFRLGKEDKKQKLNRRQQQAYL